MSEVVLNNGDVWYTIEFIFSVSCCWAASKMYVVWVSVYECGWGQPKECDGNMKLKLWLPKHLLATLMVYANSCFVPQDIHTSLLPSLRYHLHHLSPHELFVPLRSLPSYLSASIGNSSSPFLLNMHYYFCSYSSSSPLLTLFSSPSPLLSIPPSFLLSHKTISLECLWGDCANGAH